MRRARTYSAQITQTGTRPMAMVLMGCGLFLTTLGWFLATRDADRLQGIVNEQSGGVVDGYVRLLFVDPDFYEAERNSYLCHDCDRQVPAGVLSSAATNPSLN